MFTWGYIKEATLAKMDMSAEEAIDLGLMNKFPYYANEAISAISGAIQPRRKYAKFTVDHLCNVIKGLEKAYPEIKLDFLQDNECKVKELHEDLQKIWHIYHSYTFINQSVKMPSDFLSFGEEIDRVTRYVPQFYNSCNCDLHNVIYEEAHDDDYSTAGTNGIIFFKPGMYEISYDAVWCRFYADMKAEEDLDLPMDIATAIPSYIASQLFKIDDETKSAIYRNEFEMAIARIDASDAQTNKTLHIRGDW